MNCPSLCGYPNEWRRGGQIEKSPREEDRVPIGSNFGWEGQNFLTDLKRAVRVLAQQCCSGFERQLWFKSPSCSQQRLYSLCPPVFLMARFSCSAVKVGRILGVYEDWASCFEQVTNLVVFCPSHCREPCIRLVAIQVLSSVGFVVRMK